MIISESNKFIFVHNYKVAGESIREALEEYSIHPLEKLSTLKCQIAKLGIIGDPNKKHLKSYQIRRLFPNEWKKYFTFGFVRNPWSWQVSLYFYMLQNEDHWFHDEIRSMDGFEDYIEWRVKEDRVLQSSFFCDKSGKIIVDFVGRLENIQSDFREVCRRIGIGASLPHKNESNHRDYKNYYNRHTKNLVKKGFKKDIEKFGYSFDGSGRIVY